MWTCSKLASAQSTTSDEVSTTLGAARGQDGSLGWNGVWMEMMMMKKKKKKMMMMVHL